MACDGCAYVYDLGTTHSPRQTVAYLQDTLFLSLLVKTHVMTLCCGFHPLGPTVDRHSSVNSGARYRRLTSCVRVSARPRPPCDALAGDVNAVHHVTPRG